MVTGQNPVYLGKKARRTKGHLSRGASEDLIPTRKFLFMWYSNLFLFKIEMYIQLHNYTYVLKKKCSCNCETGFFIHYMNRWY